MPLTPPHTEDSENAGASSPSSLPGGKRKTGFTRKLALRLAEQAIARQNAPKPSAATELDLKPRRSLAVRLALRLVLIPTGIGILICILAGTWRFWQGWAYTAVYYLVGQLGLVFLARSNPLAVERRLQLDEQIPEQIFLHRWLKIFQFLIFILPCLDYRMGWSRALLGTVSLRLSLGADGLILAATLFSVWVMYVNGFAARTVRVEAGQEVISSGPYRLLRHPMYFAFTLQFLAAPLALGSWVTWPLAFLPILIYVRRLRNEEKFLREKLPGYEEYCRQTRYRMIPFLW